MVRNMIRVTYLTVMREYMYKLQITKAYVCNEVKVLCNALKLSVYWYAVFGDDLEGIKHLLL